MSPTATKSKKVKIDEKHSDGVQKRMQNLVQYSDKKKPVKKEDSLLPDGEVKDGMIEIDLPDGTKAMVPASCIGASGAISPTIKAVLDGDELKIYSAEVQSWIISHPDWTMKEDLDDVHSIAIEKVIQFRLLLKKRRQPRADIEKDYNSSIYRQQAFRQNLAARRADRISGKGTVVNQTNIAVIAARLDEDGLKPLIAKDQLLIEEEDQLFKISE